eukprot:COSAG03_NODE_618_length_6677_cov_12.024932_1_plen_32_part_10
MHGGKEGAEKRGWEEGGGGGGGASCIRDGENT